MHDVGLQHAIGALALNNMRMKDAGVLPNFLAATAAEDAVTASRVSTSS
jgi:hypothetical protein